MGISKYFCGCPRGKTAFKPRTTKNTSTSPAKARYLRSPKIKGVQDQQPKEGTPPTGPMRIAIPESVQRCQTDINDNDNIDAGSGVSKAGNQKEPTQTLNPREIVGRSPAAITSIEEHDVNIDSLNNNTIYNAEARRAEEIDEVADVSQKDKDCTEKRGLDSDPDNNGAETKTGKECCDTPELSQVLHSSPQFMAESVVGAPVVAEFRPREGIGFCSHDPYGTIYFPDKASARTLFCMDTGSTRSWVVRSLLEKGNVKGRPLFGDDVDFRGLNEHQVLATEYIEVSVDLPSFPILGADIKCYVAESIPSGACVILGRDFMDANDIVLGLKQNKEFVLALGQRKPSQDAQQNRDELARKRKERHEYSKGLQQQNGSGSFQGNFSQQQGASNNNRPEQYSQNNFFQAGYPRNGTRSAV